MVASTRSSPSQARPGVADRLAGVEHIDEGRIEVVDLQPHGVLVLGVEHLLGLLGDDDADLALLVDVDGLDEDDAVAVIARPLRRIAAVGDAIGTGEDERVGPKPGREDVRLGLGNLLEFGAQPVVHLRQPGNGRVQGEAIRRPVVGPVRHLKRPVDRGPGWLGCRPVGAILAAPAGGRARPSLLAAESTSRCCIETDGSGTAGRLA